MASQRGAGRPSDLASPTASYLLCLRAILLLQRVAAYLHRSTSQDDQALINKLFTIRSRAGHASLSGTLKMAAVRVLEPIDGNIENNNAAETNRRRLCWKTALQALINRASWIGASSREGPMDEQFLNLILERYPEMSNENNRAAAMSRSLGETFQAFLHLKTTHTALFTTLATLGAPARANLSVQSSVSGLSTLNSKINPVVAPSTGPYKRPSYLDPASFVEGLTRQVSYSSFKQALDPERKELTVHTTSQLIMLALIVSAAPIMATYQTYTKNVRGQARLAQTGGRPGLSTPATAAATSARKSDKDDNTARDILSTSAFSAEREGRNTANLLNMYTASLRTWRFQVAKVQFVTVRWLHSFVLKWLPPAILDQQLFNLLLHRALTLFPSPQDLLQPIATVLKELPNHLSFKDTLLRQVAGLLLDCLPLKESTVTRLLIINQQEQQQKPAATPASVPITSAVLRSPSTTSLPPSSSSSPIISFSSFSPVVSFSSSPVVSFSSSSPVVSFSSSSPVVSFSSSSPVVSFSSAPPSPAPSSLSHSNPPTTTASASLLSPSPASSSPPLPFNQNSGQSSPPLHFDSPSLTSLSRQSSISSVSSFPEESSSFTPSLATRLSRGDTLRILEQLTWRTLPLLSNPDYTHTALQVLTSFQPYHILAYHILVISCCGQIMFRSNYILIIHSTSLPLLSKPDYAHSALQVIISLPYRISGISYFDHTYFDHIMFQSNHDSVKYISIKSQHGISWHITAFAVQTRSCTLCTAGYQCYVMSHHIISYHIISYHIISYHIITYHIISYHIISYHIMSCHIISYHIISYHIISYHIISFHIISYHFISFHIISYHFISSHIISHHITSHHITSHHIISYHIISYHIISYHITSHHIISYHTIPYHIIHHIISYHIISYHIISHHIISYHLTSPHITSHHITSHHITSHHITA
eukprot:g14546.t1